MDWLKIFRHLLPRAAAWRLFDGTSIKRHFEGYGQTLTDVKDYFDQIFSDIDPAQTRELPRWETQFALPDTVLSTTERRTRLAAAWAAQGGQSPRYIEDTLQAAGFTVFVHEWWVPATNPPVARVPSTYLADGIGGTPFLVFDGATDMQDGDAVAQDGSRSDPMGYPLVNKLLESIGSTIGDGGVSMQDGNASAQDEDTTLSFTRKLYVIPTNPLEFPHFIYIGGQTFPNAVNLPQARRDEFEDLCLKICPLEKWIGVLVTYS